MIGPGSILVFLDRTGVRAGPIEAAQVCCRKADDSGWWLRDGGGLADVAIGAAGWFEVEVRAPVDLTRRGCGREVPRR